ncbi:MAG TPA: STAS domain-containing protein [Gemmataceae bacterium]|jgi:anti-sigma B factor antagonist|nr:STAS domain-containing protein [Gemmataceae bacterium]
MSSSPVRLLLHREDVGDLTVITFKDARILDEQKIQALGDQLFKLVEQAGRKDVVLSFEHVDYLSSHMVAKILTLHKKLRAAGGRVVLCELKPEIYENLKTANLDKVLEIRPHKAPDLGPGEAQASP